MQGNKTQNLFVFKFTIAFCRKFIMPYVCARWLLSIKFGVTSRSRKEQTEKNPDTRGERKWAWAASTQQRDKTTPTQWAAEAMKQTKSRQIRFAAPGALKQYIQIQISSGSTQSGKTIYFPKCGNTLFMRENWKRLFYR